MHWPVDYSTQAMTTSSMTVSTVFLTGLILRVPLLFCMAFFLRIDLTALGLFFPLVYCNLLMDFCLAIILILTKSHSTSDMGVSCRIILVVKIEELTWINIQHYPFVLSWIVQDGTQKLVWSRGIFKIRGELPIQDVWDFPARRYLLQETCCCSRFCQILLHQQIFSTGTIHLHRNYPFESGWIVQDSIQKLVWSWRTLWLTGEFQIQYV